MLRIFRFRGVWTLCQSTRSYTQKSSETERSFRKIMENIRRVKPSNQPPKVWELLEKMTRDGKPLKFSIQEIPKDRYEDAIQHMCDNFLVDEPTCKCQGKFFFFLIDYSYDIIMLFYTFILCKFSMKNKYNNKRAS